MRVRCGAVFVDAGGVIVLPHRGLVQAALAAAQIEIDASAVPRAHYHAARQLDRDAGTPSQRSGYLRPFCRALGIPADRLADATRALSRVADRRLSGAILWSEAAPQARDTLGALERAGIRVLVVTNSDGHAAENLRDAGICQTTPGAGATITDVIDSTLVGAAKPDPRIFRVALQRAKAKPAEVVHVGDMVSTDIAGARAAGVIPIHLDPYRSCRARDHRHIRSLAGVWRHIAPAAR